MINVTDIAICNMALAHLGQAPIVSLTEAQESARALNRIYAITRDTVLRAKHWRFATVKEALVEVADQDIPGWEYTYVYPAKCLCIREIFYDAESQNPAPIEFETMFIPALNQKVIVTNFAESYIEYTYQMADPTLFDMSFATAFSFLLAAQVAKPLTGDDDMAKLMLQIYGSLVSDAGRINDGEKYIKKEQVSSFEESR